MESKIVEIGAFTVIGEKRSVNVQEKKLESVISEFWKQSNENEGLSSKLLRKNDGKIEGLLGIFQSYVSRLHGDYWIATHSSETEGVDQLEIPAATWVKFEVRGQMPEAIKQAWKQIKEHELPANQWTYSMPIAIEFYPPSFTINEENYCEIWIPIG